MCFTYAPKQRLRVFGSMDGSRETMLETPNATELCPANAARSREDTASARTQRKRVTTT